VGESKALISRTAVSKQRQSDEQLGFAVAALRVVELVPVRSRVVICGRSEYVVDAINGDVVDKWLDQGRLAGRRPVKYSGLWMAYLRAREGGSAGIRSISVLGELLRQDEARGQEIVAKLMQEAKKACQARDRRA
jgi:ribonuclease HI